MEKILNTRLKRFELLAAFVVVYYALQALTDNQQASGVSQTMTVTASGLVVALTQVTKWAKWTGVEDRRGPIIVVILSLLLTGMIAWTQNNFGRTTVIDYVAVFVNILLAAAGVFGFTRSAPSAVSSFTKPPEQGAGSSPTQ